MFLMITRARKLAKAGKEFGESVISEREERERWGHTWCKQRGIERKRCERRRPKQVRERCMRKNVDQKVNENEGDVSRSWRMAHDSHSMNTKETGPTRAYCTSI
jgi:hypothetical protein